MEAEIATPPSEEAVSSVNELYYIIYTAFLWAIAYFNAKWDTAYPLYAILVSPNGTTYLGTNEFIVFEKLGPKIIPFIVFKLARDTSDNL